MLQLRIVSTNTDINAIIRRIARLDDEMSIIEIALFAVNNASMDSLWEQLGFDEEEQKKMKKICMYFNEAEQKVEICKEELKNLRDEKDDVQQQLQEKQMTSIICRTDDGEKATKDFSRLLYIRDGHSVHFNGKPLTTFIDEQYKFGRKIDKAWKKMKSKTVIDKVLDIIFDTAKEEEENDDDDDKSKWS